jgi:hypothetical protein
VRRPKDQPQAFEDLQVLQRAERGVALQRVARVLLQRAPRVVLRPRLPLRAVLTRLPRPRPQAVIRRSLTSLLLIPTPVLAPAPGAARPPLRQEEAIGVLRPRRRNPESEYDDD